MYGSITTTLIICPTCNQTIEIHHPEFLDVSAVYHTVKDLKNDMDELDNTLNLGKLREMYGLLMKHSSKVVKLIDIFANFEKHFCTCSSENK